MGPTTDEESGTIHFIYGYDFMSEPYNLRSDQRMANQRGTQSRQSLLG